VTGGAGGAAEAADRDGQPQAGEVVDEQQCREKLRRVAHGFGLEDRSGEEPEHDVGGGLDAHGQHDPEGAAHHVRGIGDLGGDLGRDPSRCRADSPDGPHVEHHARHERCDRSESEAVSEEVVLDELRRHRSRIGQPVEKHGERDEPDTDGRGGGQEAAGPAALPRDHDQHGDRQGDRATDDERDAGHDRAFAERRSSDDDGDGVPLVVLGFEGRVRQGHHGVSLRRTHHVHARNPSTPATATPDTTTAACSTRCGP
jgi:hypothetical protein